MIIETLAAIGIYLAAAAVVEGFSWGCRAWKRRGLKKRVEEWCVTLPLTEEDKQLIARNRELMKVFFSSGIEDTFKDLSLELRQELMKNLIEQASQIYGLELNVLSFMPSTDIGECTYGFYNPDTNSVAINLDALASNEPDVLREIVGTIFHELRHGQQYRAVRDENYVYGSQEQLLLWAINFMEGNYIPAEVDFVLYQKQAVEADARQIAEYIIENF